MSTTPAAFRRQLGAQELKPVYLIAGAEPLLVIEAADALRARARELGYLEREVLDVESGFDWNRLADAARSMSLFASRRVIDCGTISCHSSATARIARPVPGSTTFAKPTRRL